MTCEWGHSDCKYEGFKCYTCFSDSVNYIPIKQKKHYTLNRKQTNKPDKRKGSNFEYNNHNNNIKILKDDAISSMTLNSGATIIEKGDEQISGIIEIMEELKTQMPDRTKGIKSFTIKREWLDKLHREALQENKEFWYLKFAFSEDETNHVGGQVFVVTEQDIIMSMIKTMVEDRKVANRANALIDVANKRKELIEAENIKLRAEVALLRAENNLKTLDSS